MAQTQFVKLFKLINGHEGLEKEMNDWIIANPQYEVITVAYQTHCHPGNQLGLVDREAILFYKTKA